MKSELKVAFIGLGNMGSGMANNILKAGFDLSVWNRTQAKMVPFVASGAKGALTPEEAVRDADVVITSLMDDKSILSVLQQENGILAGMKAGAVHICVATISPLAAEEIAKIHEQHGTHYLAGPVVGRPNAAAAGELATFLAGDAAVIEKVTPVCDSYTNKVIALPGKHGAANTLKLCINYGIISIIEILGEVYSLCEKSGADSNVLNAFYESIFAHPALKMYTTKIRTRDFDGAGGFGMEGGLKDIRLMLETSSAHGVSFEIGKIIEKKMVEAIDSGMGERDWSAIYEITRQQSGLQ